MKLKEIKKWIDGLPSEFLEYTVINAEKGNLDDGEHTYRLDKPIISLDVDGETKEILFLNEN